MKQQEPGISQEVIEQQPSKAFLYKLQQFKAKKIE